MKYLALSLSLLIISCDNFMTRDPETPDSGRSNFQTPTTPDVVMSNLVNSFTNKNTVNYLRNFQDDQLFIGDILFVPSQNVQALFPTFFDTWDLNNEQIVVNNLFNSMNEGSIPLLSFQNKQIQQNPGNAQIRADYFITVNHNQEEFATEYEGAFLLKLVATVNDYWYITEWTDFSSSTTITNSWSNLKFNFGR